VSNVKVKKDYFKAMQVILSRSENEKIQLPQISDTIGVATNTERR